MASQSNQKMGMSISIWGPAAWSFLHTAAFAYGTDPEKPTAEEKKHAMQFFTVLPYMLPCSICRAHYLEHIKKHPPNVTNRDSLSRWVVKIHNIVNANSGKPIVPYEHVREHYAGGRQWLTPDVDDDNPELCALRMKSKINEYIVYFLLLLVVGYMVYLCFSKKTTAKA